MGKSFDEILSDEQPSEVTETPETEPGPETAVAEPVTEEASGQPRDEQGRFAPKEPTGVEAEQVPDGIAPVPVPPTEPVNQLPREEYQALRAVRDENRDLKRQIDAIQRQLAQPAPPPQPQQPPVDFWDDPQSFMDSRMNQLGQTLLQQWEQRENAKRLDQSEQAARSKYADFDVAYAAVEEAIVNGNTRLQMELAQAPDPGEFVYAKGKAMQAIQSVGSLDELKAQLRAELEAEARAAIAPAKPFLPSTTAADGSVGGRSGPAWTGAKPLGQILGN